MYRRFSIRFNVDGGRWVFSDCCEVLLLDPLHPTEAPKSPDKFTETYRLLRKGGESVDSNPRHPHDWSSNYCERASKLKRISGESQEHQLGSDGSDIWSG